MGERDPLVSVILPTFNREAYLREAMASVVTQTYANWELIVADDGSTDGTRAYLASLRDPRMRVVLLEHGGIPARTRNAALAQATGRYVAFLDDDDLWMPEKLARQVADLAAKPTCRWGYTYFTQVGPQGEHVAFPRGQHPEPYAGWIAPALVEGRAWVATPGLLVERDLIRSVGGFDESLTSSEDYDAEIRMAMTSEVSVIPRALFARRVHAGNTWKRQTVAAVYECQLRVYGRLRSGDVTDAVRRAAKRQYAVALVRLADTHRATGANGEALRALMRALWRGAALPAWWAALAKTCLRPLLPPAALRAYYAWRNG